MAIKENIKDRFRRINPEAIKVSEIFNEEYRKILKETRVDGIEKVGADVTVTEDMTVEEEEMAIFEGFLKEGYDISEADIKTKEFISILNTL